MRARPSKDKPEFVKKWETKVLAQKLLGKVALVTGGARGLGRSYVLRLARLGADVVVNDINLDAYKEYKEQITASTVMDEVRSFGRSSLGIKADVTKKAEVDAVFKEILDEFGKLDILVCNAGGGLRPPGARGNPWRGLEDFFFQFNVNFFSTLFCCEAAAISMKKQRSGKIVTVASQAGMHATVPRRAVNDEVGFRGSYGIAKAGIIQYTRQLAARLGRYNINVNCIAPGFILSSRAIVGQKRNEPEQRKRLESQIALGRLGWPEDCAKVVEFLVTDLSDYVTGQTIPVGGGYVLFH